MILPSPILMHSCYFQNFTLSLASDASFLLQFVHCHWSFSNIFYIGYFFWQNKIGLGSEFDLFLSYIAFQSDPYCLYEATIIQFTHNLSILIKKILPISGWYRIAPLSYIPQLRTLFVHSPIFRCNWHQFLSPGLHQTPRLNFFLGYWNKWLWNWLLLHHL